MPSGISHFIDKTSGPQNLGRRLRQKTALIRILSRDLKKLYHANSKFPANVFGGKLISVFSSRLQDMLEIPILPDKRSPSKRSMAGGVIMNSEINERQQQPTNELLNDPVSGQNQTVKPNLPDSDIESLPDIFRGIINPNNKSIPSSDSPSPILHSGRRYSHPTMPDNRDYTATDDFQGNNALQSSSDLQSSNPALNPTAKSAIWNSHPPLSDNRHEFTDNDFESINARQTSDSKSSSALAPLLHEYWHAHQSEQVSNQKAIRGNIEPESMHNEETEFPNLVMPPPKPKLMGKDRCT